MTAAQSVSFRAGIDLAYRHEQAESRKTGIFWLSGLKSDMAGTKAKALAEMARASSRPMLRFDYSGHGLSGGRFEDQTLSDWLGESLAMFRKVSKGGQIIVGSSMGAYLALLLYRALRTDAPDHEARIRGLVLIAPAADMTEALLWAKLNDQARQTMLTTGQAALPSAYGEPMVVTRQLIEDGRKHLILAEGIEAGCPVHILQGEDDADVPWQHAQKLFKALKSEEILFTLVKGGDHRLSSPRDLGELVRVTEAFCLRADRETPASPQEA